MKLLVSILLSLLCICLFAPTPLSAAAKVKSTGKEKPSINFPRILLQQASSDSFKVNSFLIETPKSVILVDTQFTNLDYPALSEFIKNAGKPLAAVIISHPHPDHYNNIAPILKDFKGVNVYATAETRAAIIKNDPTHRKIWSGIYQSFYPAETALPNKLLNPGENLNFDGVEIKTEQLLSGESASQLILYLPAIKSLLVGDLVYNGVHANTRDAKVKVWLKHLDQLLSIYPEGTKIYPGHGDSGGIELLTRQKEYLTTLLETIRTRMTPDDDESPLPISAYTEIIGLMETKYRASSNFLINAGIPSIVEELLPEFPRLPDNPFGY